VDDVRLLRLGTVSPLRSQTCYHAAAEAMGEDSPDTVILVSPSSPYVCVGFHQDPEKEVDLDYCRSRGWPVYRREVGGGAVYLDRNQLFVQWVFRSPSLPAGVEDRFALYVRPLVQTYRDLGIPARHRPVNDIHVGDRKIGGTGAAEIGKAQVLVGSFIFDFDRKAMARVLKVPSEKMRDKVFQGLEQYMTTLRDEAGRDVDREAVVGRYLVHCAEALGRRLSPGAWTGAEEARAREIDLRFGSPDWLFQKGVSTRSGVKIHEDVAVVESAFKSPGGLIRLTARLRAGRVEDLSISGDFTLFPRTAVGLIERSLRGIGPDEAAARAILEELYQKERIESPGIAPAHWARALGQALRP
jgi:lipoate-protein ligase A